jgi:hypothetical protein
VFTKVIKNAKQEHFDEDTKWPFKRGDGAQALKVVIAEFIEFKVDNNL